MIQASLSSKDQSSLQLNASTKGSPLPAIKLLNDLQTSKSLSSRSLTNLISASNLLLNGSRKSSLKSDPEVEVLIHKTDSQSNISVNKSVKGSQNSIRSPQSYHKTLNIPQYGTYLHVPGTIPAVVSDEFRRRCHSDSRKTGLAINVGPAGSVCNSVDFGSAHILVSDEEGQYSEDKSVYFFTQAWWPFKSNMYN